MKPITFILTSTLALALCACGGRAKLDNESGRSFRNLWQAQALSRPSPGLGDMAASDAKTAMYNHDAMYRMGQSSGGGGSQGMSIVPGNKGGIDPSTTDFGGDSGGDIDRSGIRLEAR